MVYSYVALDIYIYKSPPAVFEKEYRNFTFYCLFSIQFTFFPSSCFLLSSKVQTTTTTTTMAEHTMSETWDIGNGTMQAVVWNGDPYHMSVETRPKPAIINGTDAIVKVSTAAICGSDLHVMHGVSAKRFNFARLLFEVSQDVQLAHIWVKSIMARKTAAGRWATRPLGTLTALARMCIITRKETMS